MLNIDIENLGNIKKANIKLNKLTIFAGENNSGKTYVNYVLYKILKSKLRRNIESIYSDIVKEAKEKGVTKFNLKNFISKNFIKIKSDLEDNFSIELDGFFSATSGTFKSFNLNIIDDIDNIKEELYKISFSNIAHIGNEIACKIIKDKNSNDISFVIVNNSLQDDLYIDFIGDALFRHMFPIMNNDVFLLPAERTGLNLFYQELNSNRNDLFNNLQKNKTSLMEALQNMTISSYSEPVSDYIDFLNKTTILKKEKSELRDLNEKIHSKILKGKYHIDKDGDISFIPYDTHFKGGQYLNKLELHLSSSTVKTFFSLDFYLEYMAKEGGFLIIDEPELNLHPDNQRNIARLIAQIVNRGVNVIISTHSDYIVREFNNLIMLNPSFEGKDEKMKKYKYDDSETISYKKVNAYFVDKGSVKPMEINENEGIIADTFDDTINSLNESSDDIYYTKMENKNSE